MNTLDRPTLSVQERKEIEATRAPGVPPQPPRAPELTLEPPFFEACALASCLGGDIAAARHQLAGSYAEKVKRIQRLCPDTFQEIQETLEAIVSATEHYHSVTAVTFEAINEVEQALISRATKLRESQVETSSLQEAKATLESPTSLNLAGDELLALQAKTKFLPGRISELSESGAGFEATINRISAAFNIDVPGLVEELVSRCRGHNGHVVDHQLYEVVKSGFLDPSPASK